MDCLDEETVVAFVNGALRGPALAAVERHLVDCPACATLIAVAAPPAGDGGRSGSPAPELAVGRYRLLQLVGRGGMGEVYAAHDPELDRRVAIKILRADAHADSTVEAARLAREARAVAKLSHPNVVAIYDVGSSAGRMFLAMELVEGETLAVWLAQHPRTTSEIVALFLMAGRGLAAAHRAGIVHRDFKPQNVMVARDGSARVMDFGLAAAGPGHTQQVRLTKAGAILGTPLYMSPEQMVGQPVDPRADQFSFCVALWEALHGARPFEGSTVLELRSDVLAGRPRPGPLRSRVPRQLQAALLRGLSVDRTRRFPEMNALLDELIVAPTGAPRRTAVVGVALGLALAGLLGGGVVWRARARKVAACDPAPRLANVWETSADGRTRLEMRAAFLGVGKDVPDAHARFDRVSQILDRYTDEWARGSRAACEAADHAADSTAGLRSSCLDRRRAELAALTDVLVHADAKVVGRSIAAVTSLVRLDGCADLVALRSAPLPPDNRELRARVDHLTGRLLALQANAAAGHDWQSLQPIRALTEEVRGADDEPLLVETLLVDARIRSPFDPEAAIPLYEEAYRRAAPLHLDDFAAEAAIQLAAIEGAFQHRFADGQRWAGLGKAALEQAGAHERLRGWFFNVRGALDAAQGQWRRAETDFASSASVREQTLGSAHPDLAAALVNLSKAMLMLNEAAEARNAAGRAFELASAVFPSDAYEVNAALLARAHALVALDRVAEARADVTTVEASFEKALGRDHPFLADPMTVLGEVALAEGRPLDARAVLERAWEIRSTHVADAGAREETAFALARAIWGSAEADRPHALELAVEARDGYAAIPELAPRLAVVRKWIAERTDASLARQARR